MAWLALAISAFFFVNAADASGAGSAVVKAAGFSTFYPQQQSHGSGSLSFLAAETTSSSYPAPAPAAGGGAGSGGAEENTSKQKAHAHDEHEHDKLTDDQHSPSPSPTNCDVLQLIFTALLQVAPEVGEPIVQPHCTTDVDHLRDFCRLRQLGRASRVCYDDEFEGILFPQFLRRRLQCAAHPRNLQVQMQSDRDAIERDFAEFDDAPERGHLDNAEQLRAAAFGSFLAGGDEARAAAALAPTTNHFRRGASPFSPESDESDAKGLPNFVRRATGAADAAPDRDDRPGEGKTLPNLLPRFIIHSPFSPENDESGAKGLPNFVRRATGAADAAPDRDDRPGEGKTLPNLLPRFIIHSPFSPENDESGAKGLPNFVRRATGAADAAPDRDDRPGEGKTLPNLLPRFIIHSPFSPESDESDAEGLPNFVRRATGAADAAPDRDDRPGEGKTLPNLLPRFINTGDAKEAPLLARRPGWENESSLADASLRVMVGLASQGERWTRAALEKLLAHAVEVDRAGGHDQLMGSSTSTSRTTLPESWPDEAEPWSPGGASSSSFSSRSRAAQSWTVPARPPWAMDDHVDEALADNMEDVNVFTSSTLHELVANVIDETTGISCRRDCWSNSLCRSGSKGTSGAGEQEAQGAGQDLLYQLQERSQEQWGNAYEWFRRITRMLADDARINDLHSYCEGNEGGGQGEQDEREAHANKLFRTRTVRNVARNTAFLEQISAAFSIFARQRSDPEPARSGRRDVLKNLCREVLVLFATCGSRKAVELLLEHAAREDAAPSSPKLVSSCDRVFGLDGLKEVVRAWKHEKDETRPGVRHAVLDRTTIQRAADLLGTRFVCPAETTGPPGSVDDHVDQLFPPPAHREVANWLTPRISRWPCSQYSNYPGDGRDRCGPLPPLVADLRERCRMVLRDMEQ